MPTGVRLCREARREAECSALVVALRIPADFLQGVPDVPGDAALPGEGMLSPMFHQAMPRATGEGTVRTEEGIPQLLAALSAMSRSVHGSRLALACPSTRNFHAILPGSRGRQPSAL